MRLMLTAGTAALLIAASAMAQPATESAPVPDTAPSAVTNPEPSVAPTAPSTHPDTTAPAPETTPVPDVPPPPSSTAPVSNNNNAITTRETAKGTAPGTTDRAKPLNNVRAPANPAVKTTEGNNPGAPFAGANSFTAGQAKARIESRGFSNVSTLAKDDQGIWRGKAQKDGQTVDIGLDYQGNVVVR